MKTVLLPLLLFLMASCAATRQSAQSTSTNESLTEKTEEQSTKTEKVVDTTKTENGKITITEIEFYPPIESEEPQDKTNATRTGPKPKKPKQSNVAGVNLSNVGNIKDAAIKSIKQTTIENGSEQKGESKESSESKVEQKEAVATKNDQTSQMQTSPAPDPYRWRYIFYILLLIGVALLYLKRVPLLNWIKKIISGIRRIV